MMLDPWVVIAVIFAAYRVTFFVVLEDGPAGVMRAVRRKLGAYNYGSQRGPDGMPQAVTEIGRAVTCPVCVSPFAVAGCLAVAVLGGPVGQWVVLGLAAAGGVLALIRWRAWR